MIDLNTILPWSQPREINTRNGKRVLRTAAPTESFSALWRSNKDALKAAGIGWGKDRSGNWEVCWWSNPDPDQVRKEEAAVEASRAADAPVTVEIPAPEGLSYLPYQRAGIAAMAGRSANLLGDEMGLGKTIQAIGLINCDASVRRVLVMCPATLKANWRRELAKWLVRPLRVGVQVSSDPWCGSACDVVVMNYDIAHRFESQIAGENWDLFVADEAHYLKNPKAKRTAVVLGRKARKDRKTGTEVPGHDGVRARKRVFMTGTPVVNRPMELFPMLHSLDPKKWPSGFKFGLRYAAGHQTRWGWDFNGASNLDELQRELRATVMVRRLKKDVLTDLPAKRRQIIELPADGLEDMVADEAARADRLERSLAHLRAKAEVAALADDQEQYAELSKQLGAATMVAFEEMSEARRQIAMAKLPMVVEHVKSVLDQNGKVVVMAHHRDMIDALVAELSEYGAVKLYGGMTDAAKDAAVQSFQNDPACRVFVGGIKAAGVGLTLTASSHVVFAELDWVPGVVSQAEDRCHRIGQTESVLVQHLVLEGSLDSRMVKFIVRKQDVIDRALDKGALKIEAAMPVLSVTVGSVLDDSTEPRKAGTPQPQVVPYFSDETKAHVHAGLRILAGMDMDHAAVRNDIGFNKFDGQFGHALAERSFLTDKMCAAGLKLVTKYRRQLGEAYGQKLAALRGE